MGGTTQTSGCNFERRIVVYLAIQSILMIPIRFASLVALMGLFASPAHLQITLESTDLPQGGVSYPLVNTLVMDFGLLDTDGANAVWDASSLTSLGDAPVTPSPMSDASITATLAFNSPFNSSYQCDFFLPTEFPDLGIDLGIPLDGFNSFYQTDASHYAIAGIGLSSSGFDLPVTYSDIDEFFPLPFSYGETFSSSGAFTLDLTGILGYWLNQTREVTADGWGTLILPSGSYDVLRVKTELVATDSILIEQLGEPFAIDRVQTIYQWWGEDMGFPLLEITTTLGIPTISTYQDLQAPSSVHDALAAAGAAFPNPVRSGQNLQWNGSPNANWVAFDLNGKQVASGNENCWTVPASMPAGSYLISRDGQTEQLVIQR